MKFLNIFIGLFCTVVLYSCQKRDSSGFDNSKLAIAISKPQEAQVFRKGDTVFIKGTTTYTSQLHGYAIRITNKATNEVYFDIDEHLHDSFFDINTFWVDTLDKNADLVLKLTVEADHDGHEASKEVNFKSQL